MGKDIVKYQLEIIRNNTEVEVFKQIKPYFEVKMF